MGHIVNTDKEYRLLQQRLDRNITGAPDSPVFLRILQLLFSPLEATIAGKLPTRPAPLPVLAQKLALPAAELAEMLTVMAAKGLVFDLEYNGQRCFSLAPVVIGFFEFTFMRTRSDLPMKDLAQLFETYMLEDDRFAKDVFQGKTQLGRSLVQEEALPKTDFTEILDWERTSFLLEAASTLAVSLCACRHKTRHLGKDCGKPLRTCLTLNRGADILIRSGIAEEISLSEARSIIRECKAAGLAQTGDNVKNQVGYICNCCGCCCGMFQAMKKFAIRGAVVTSNWIAEISDTHCRGCGRCVALCPVGAIVLQSKPGSAPQRQVAVRDAELCLGCGVCRAGCQFDALFLRPRPQRVLTPENAFDRIVTMAIERGKLAELLFDQPDQWSHRALGRISHILEMSPPVQALLAIKPVRSVFLQGLLSGAKMVGKI